MTLTTQLHAINRIKHRIRDAMEAVGVDCNWMPFYLYANALMRQHGLDAITTSTPPAAVTLEAKLAKLAGAKAYLAQAINACGGTVDENMPFRDYPSQIMANLLLLEGAATGPYGQSATGSTASTSLTYQYSIVACLKTIRVSQVIVEVEPGEYTLTINGTSHGTAQTAADIGDITFSVDTWLLAGESYNFRITRTSGTSRFRYTTTIIQNEVIQYSAARANTGFSNGPSTYGYMLGMRVVGKRVIS